MKNNKKYPTLNRYSYPDAYTMLELKWRYEHAERKEKIALLEDLQKSTSSIPDFLIELVVADKDEVVRQWLAKNDDWGLDKKITSKLLEDQDEYVRASALENKNTFGILSLTLDFLNKASSTERTAAIRGGHISSDILEKLFDHKNTELKIPPKERVELITAYLTNAAEIEDSRKDFFDHVDGIDAAFTSLKFQKLWQLISEWPKDFNAVKRLVYIYLGNDDKNKVEIYKKSPDNLKLAILEGCTGDGLNDDEVIELGLKSKEEFVKKEAYKKVSALKIKNDELNKLLESEDKGVIGGIAYNKNFPLSVRRRAASRLRDLGDDLEAYWLKKEHEEEEVSGEENEEANLSFLPTKAKKDKTKWFGYGWTVLVNLVALGIIMALFDSASYDYFQTKVYAILVIIYLSVQGFLTQYSLTTTNLTFGLDTEFKRIRKLLKNTPDEIELETAETNKGKAEKAIKKMYINAIFMFIAYLIALFNLLGAL